MSGSLNSASDLGRAPRFPFVLVAAAAATMIGLMAWSRWEDYVAGNEHSAEVSRYVGLAQTSTRVLYLDEVLTMLARMAASTGDEEWIRRYRRHEPELGRLIKQALELAPSAKGLEAVASTDAANRRLLEMANASFDLVRAKRLEEASALLNGPEYRRQEETYANGMDAFAREVRAQQENDILLDGRRHWVSFLARMITSVLVVGLWCLALWGVAFAWRRKIDQQRAAAEELRLKGMLLESQNEASIDGILNVDADGRMIWFNRRFLEMWGIPPDVAQSRSDTAAIQCVLGQLVEPDAFETRIRHVYAHPDERSRDEIQLKDGRTIDRYSAPVTSEAGAHLGRVWLFRDITEQKRMERELRRLAVIAEQAAEGIAVADLDGNLQFVNHAWARMHGYESGAELVGKHLRVFHTDEQLKTEVLPFNATVKRQGHNWAEVGHVRRDGTTFPTQMSVVVLKDEQGEPYGMAGFAEDITQRKRAEQERRRLAAILEATPDFVGFADAKDAHILYINKAGRLMTGLTPDEDVTRLKIPDVHPEWANQMLKETVLPTAGRDGVWTGECAFLHRDGHEVPVLMALLAHKASSGEVEVFSTISRDISERKQAEAELCRSEEALRQAKNVAEAASAAKGAFLANMSHEIRTPMTAILGFADLLAESLECCHTCHEHAQCQVRAQNREHVRVICASGRHLLGVINDVLDLSKIEAGKMDIEARPCRLMSVIAEVASFMRVKSSQCGVELAVESETEIPETISTDAARLRQALLNLVGNAIKFTEHGSVKVAVAFVPEWRNGQPAVTIRVIDTGIGITPETLANLFEPFAQADSSTSRKYGGSGLGLAISRRIADLLGGELAAQSVLGKGSTFTLTIPTGPLDGVPMLHGPVEAVSHGDRTAPASTRAPTLAGLRILLAEDGPDNQLLLKTFLQKAGASVEVAGNGKVALDKVKAAGATGYDVVLMDMQMPEMDGYTAVRALRQSGYERPVLALTAHAMSGDRRKCLSCGCNDYLTKPVDRGELLETVARWGKSPASAGNSTVAKSPGGLADDEAQVIESHFAGDPEMAPLIDKFVAGLSDKMALMWEFHRGGCHEDLRRMAHQLKGSAGGYGYPSLTEQARVLGGAAGAPDPEAEASALRAVAQAVQAICRGRRAPAATKEHEA